ncbi:hypothetical protein STEG23_035274 [Scotinomys teguina]
MVVLPKLHPSVRKQKDNFQKSGLSLYRVDSKDQFLRFGSKCLLLKLQISKCKIEIFDPFGIDLCTRTPNSALNSDGISENP